MKRVLVTGCGGFIGHHLAIALRRGYGCWVRGADLKAPEFSESEAHDFQIADLRDFSNCLKVTEGIDEVYNLAADMGGIGYITSHLADIARNNVLINVNMLEAARINGVKKFLFSSSACVYAQSKQLSTQSSALQEGDAYPADPEPGYGWEKLFAEQMCEYYKKDYGLDIRLVRFHNVFGPLGTYYGGKEKSPAALCRKIAHAPKFSAVEVWGDGKQTRSYMYIADCVDGLVRIMESTCSDPLNLGRTELVTVDGLFDAICKISDKVVSISHNLDRPQGVRGRNSDNSKLVRVLKWEPEISLERGLKYTYDWIQRDIQAHNFYSMFMGKNDRVFDIGANVGNKTRLFQDLGANVLAVEPQKSCVDYFRKRFPDTKIMNQGVGRSPGFARITFGEASGLSSFSPDWIDAVKRAQRFVGHSWGNNEEIPITTLDELIREYGSPKFIKIDVEGYESEVIAGLSAPVQALSFEFHPEFLSDTEKCINHIQTLGNVSFNYSLEESMQLALPEYVSGPELMGFLNPLRGNNIVYGDVYARFI